jgi:hypothetical protein
MRRLGRVLGYILLGLAWLFVVVFFGASGYLIYRLALGIMAWTGPGPVAVYGLLTVVLLALFAIGMRRRGRGKTEEEVYEADVRAYIGQANEHEYPGSLYGLGPNPGADPPDQPETPPPARGK